MGKGIIRRMQSTKATLGVILAGGLATRMGGGDKALLTLGGRPMLARVIARLRPQVSAIMLNANGDPARFADFGLPVIADPVPEYPGPLAGVLAGLEWAAKQGAARIVTAAADTPFLPEDLVARLGAAVADDDTIALAATATGLHPTFGLWPVSLRRALARDLAGGVRRVGAWAESMGARRVQFDDTPFDPFFNINTPDDLARAEQLLTGEGA
jgi:molybdenum cofactor guanylyltransferase